MECLIDLQLGLGATLEAIWALLLDEVAVILMLIKP